MAAFVRPASANQRKVDITGISTELNPGLRQMLQQNVQRNAEDSKRLFQTGKMPPSLTRNNQLVNRTDFYVPANLRGKPIGPNPAIANDYLNGLLF